MLRIFAVLVFVWVTASPALAQPPYPSDEQRISAMQEYVQGRFKPYEEYLQAELSWHIAKLHDSNIDVGMIADGIKKCAQERKVTLTQEELTDKLKTAQALYLDSGRGVQGVSIRRARELYLSLSRLYAVMSNEDKALEYRAEASKLE